MKRILISEVVDYLGREVRLSGWVNVRRDHGKIIFIDLRDRSGVIQTVVIPDQEEAYRQAKEIRPEYVVEIEGLVKERPGGAKNEKNFGGFEIEVKGINVLGKTYGDLPVEISGDLGELNLETLLNHRHLTLRNEKVKAIFKVYSEMLFGYEKFMREEGFTEIKSPKILCNATEGGANFFKIKYFDKEAYLAQSPQFYKQAGVGIFERVFEIGTVFRAEPHFTSRHVNEYTGMDAEMGFVEGFSDVMDELEKVMRYLMKYVGENCSDELALYGAQIPEDQEIPRLKLTEALEILEREYGKKFEGIDIDSEGERLISEWIKKEKGSDFVFLTHYPKSIRPFYSMPNAEDSSLTDTFDLIFRGVEIASGGQRIHDFEMLKSNIEKHRLDPKEFEDYLSIFKHGMPPHGGWGLGSERIVQKILGIENIKQVILYPRDVKRLTP
ncbi:MAG: aspartate--tRNA(Asn) ligase [Patescibacteria group bacterium]